jgi:hypothetical protein
MAWTLAGSRATPDAEMMWPRYTTESTLKEHLDRFTNKRC